MSLLPTGLSFLLRRLTRRLVAGAGRDRVATLCSLLSGEYAAASVSTVDLHVLGTERLSMDALLSEPRHNLLLEGLGSLQAIVVIVLGVVLLGVMELRSALVIQGRAQIGLLLWGVHHVGMTLEVPVELPSTMISFASLSVLLSIMDTSILVSQSLAQLLQVSLSLFITDLTSCISM